MPPENKAAKRLFVAIGAVSVFCIVVAGILNSISESNLSRTIQSMARNVQALSRTANVGAGASVDQVLSDAATKLIHQDKQIKTLQLQLHGLVHPANALYVGRTIVAKTFGTVSKLNGSITFQLAIAGGSGLDFSQTMEYRGFVMRCSPPGIVGKLGSFGVMDTRYPDLHCSIIGRR